MASSKLSDSDKQVILELYRDSEETTTSLAERYGVSTSTVSRVLKQLLPPEDYSRLIRQKRGGRSDVPGEAVSREVLETHPGENDPEAIAPVPSPVAPAPVTLSPPEPEPTALPTELATTAPESPTPEGIASPDPAPRRILAPIRRRRTSAAEPPGEPAPPAEPSSTLPPPPLDPPPSTVPIPTPIQALDETPEMAPAEWEVTSDRPLLDGDDYGEEYEEEGDLEDLEGLEGDWRRNPPLGGSQGQLEILPFAAASLQRSFYLVIDRASELITCPLKDFAELGGIPSEEEQSSTLPVFENQRLARRFSRSQLNRIIKLPDGQLLQKTQPYLEAKGITRLLIEGQVYALSGATPPRDTPDGEEVPAL